MKKTLLLYAVSAAVILVSCDKDDDDDTVVNSTDRNFTVMAAIANTAEVDAGQLAATKATDGGIRAYGQMMVADHGPAQAELKTIAAGLGLRAPDSLDAEHVALKAQLMAATGRQFDSLYIHSMVKDHQKAIDLFTNEKNQGNNN